MGEVVAVAVDDAAELVDPVRGEDIQKVVTDVLATPKHLAERAKALIE